MILIINSAGLCPAEEDAVKNRTPDEIEKFIDKIPNYFWNLLPTAAGVITAHLRKAGFPVILCDLVKRVSYSLSDQLSPDDFVQWLMNDKKTQLMNEYLFLGFKHLPAHMEKIKLIGISVAHPYRYSYALSLAKELHIRCPHIPICLGGPYITLSRHNFPGYISFIIKGHGAGPIGHLADHFMNKTPLKPDFPGLYQVSASELPGEGKNHEPADQEEIPDFSDLNLRDYLSYNLHQVFFNEKPPQPYLSLEYRTSMGCPYKCSFCSGRKVDPLQFKSVNKVIHDLEQLEALAKRFSNNNFCLNLVDLALNNSLTHLNDILAGIIESRLNFRWLTYLNVQNMPVEILEKLIRAGCKGVFWGIEAASPAMLDIYNKRYDIEKAEDLIIKAAQLKLVNIVSVIYNGPGETDEDFDALLDLMVRLSKYKRYVIVRAAKFDLFENGDIYLDPGKFNIQVSRTGDYPYSIILPTITWKEIGCDMNTLLNRHKIREIRIIGLVKKLWYG